ncbi:MAG: phospholipid/cholesterol/gamma-HCH transport system substrate-binding protein [Thermoleophilaceae bacterium]|nr:phospholipid/cholesterol/gamma-HCH transport system substrate-binding protein [Thermoleophilaceae bacterium]
MIRQIKKQLPVFVSLIVLLVGAMGVTAYLLSHQRFYLPAWVPGIGADFYVIKAELPTAQAVVPGQGQTVNVAGVKVGEVGSVNLEHGRAVVSMQIKQKYAPIYKDATILLRPKTGLKDMILALDPGTANAGKLKDGGRVAVANTLPDVNADEVLSTLDADTRAYLQILINAGGTALRDDSTATKQGAPADLREAFKRFEPTARDAAKFTSLLAKRRTNIKRAIHSFQALSTELGTKDNQLARLVDSANANFQAFAQEESALREALRLFPSTLSQTATTLNDTSDLAVQLGPALQKLRPFARELAPSLRAQRPFLRDTTPIIRDQVRPFARDVRPTVRDLKAATADLAPVAPRLTRSFKVLNRFFNELAYDPPNGESYLFWSAWAAHNGALLSTAQDAHGPMTRGIVLLTCNDYGTLESIVRGNPALGMLTRLANFPPERQVCPGNFVAPGEAALDEVPSLVPPEAATP